MHQVKKGNQWHFGMKAHIGVDAESGLVHTVIGTAANVNDVTQGHALLNGEEQVVFADAGHQGASKRPDATGVDWHVAVRPGKRKGQKHTPWGALKEQAGKVKANVRAKVEHPFRVIKRQFGYVKVCHRGACQEHRRAHHAVCAIQHLDGQKQAYAEGAGMSEPANRQRAATGLKTDRLRPSRRVIGTGISKGGAYSLMLGYQIEFWT